MSLELNLDRLFVYSEKNNKYSYIEFCDGVNIIYGINTSGKSTVFQTLLYGFGINDNKDFLQEVLEEEVIIRIDCEITKNKENKNITFIRDNDFLYVKSDDFPTKCFSGINADNSAEHIKLKRFMHELFGFSLKLESKGKYDLAPIETMFLPYYISQSVGWVSIHKSFNNLEYYKNFKYDYIDYYLGIDNFIDRDEKIKLENELKEYRNKLNFYKNLEENDTELTVSEVINENFKLNTNTFIDSYKEKKEDLDEIQNEYTTLCNQLSYYKTRKNLLNKVKKNHKEQSPIDGICPTCKRPFGNNLESKYKYYQEENDTQSQLDECIEKIKEIQSKINSKYKKIEELKQKIIKDYEVLYKYNKKEISYDTWLDYKANNKMINNIKEKTLGLYQLIEEKEKELKKFKTEKEIQKLRVSKNKDFKSIFSNYLTQLGVKHIREDKYNMLYQISVFSNQGVELLKTILAYNFAFNDLIKKTSYIHRFPFMLDAIFKEDIDEDNKEKIIKFISDYKPSDTQIIFSMASTKDNKQIIDSFNQKYFNKTANLICVGKLEKERAFLSQYDGSQDDYLREINDIIAQA